MNKEERDKRMENKLEEKDGEKCTSELMIVYIYIGVIVSFCFLFIVFVCHFQYTNKKEKQNKNKLIIDDHVHLPIKGQVR